MMSRICISFPPILHQPQDGVGRFLLLLLVGVAGLFNKNQLIFLSRWYMVIDVFQKPRRVTVIHSDRTGQNAAAHAERAVCLGRTENAGCSYEGIVFMNQFAAERIILTYANLMH